MPKRILATALFVFSLIALPQALQAAVASQADWDSHLAAKCADPHDVECLLGFSAGYDDSQTRLAWHGHYWLRAFTAMAAAYQDSKYLDYAATMIDYMLAQRDDNRAQRGELDVVQEPYTKAPPFYLNNRNLAAPCWRDAQRSNSAFDRADCKTVTDGQITSGIMRFVALVNSDPAFSGYQARAEGYLAEVVTTLDIWTETYSFDLNADIPGSYYWPREDGSGLYTTGSVPYNQSATLLTSALLVDAVQGGSGYSAMVQGLIDFWKLNLYPQANGSCLWDYSLQKPELQGVEDVNHGHLDVGFLQAAFDQGFALDTADLDCIAAAFTQNVYIGSGNLHDQIDGTTEGTSSDPHPVAAIDWIGYQAYDPAILDIALEVYETNFPVPTWSKPFQGWAEILLLTGAPSNPPADSTPPQVAITAPANGALVAARSYVDIQVAASDDVALDRVEIYVNGSLKSAIPGAGPHSFRWKVPGRKGKSHEIMAIAVDTAGNPASHVIAVTSQ